MADMASSFQDRSVQISARQEGSASMGCLPDEAVEKSVNGCLQRDPCRCRFGDHAQPPKKTDEDSGGTCRLNTIGQLARRLRAGKCIRHAGLHGFEEPRDATT